MQPLHCAPGSLHDAGVAEHSPLVPTQRLLLLGLREILQQQHRAADIPTGLSWARKRSAFFTDNGFTLILVST